MPTLPERIEDVLNADLRAYDDLALASFQHELQTSRKELRAQQAKVQAEIDRRARLEALRLDTITDPAEKAELIAFLQGRGPNPAEPLQTPP